MEPGEFCIDGLKPAFCARLRPIFLLYFTYLGNFFFLRSFVFVVVVVSFFLGGFF